LEYKRTQLVLPGSRAGARVAQIMYIHVNKCKNDKIKSKNELTQKLKWMEQASQH
jgi:hypothetical protein